MQKPILFDKYYLLERVNVGGMAEVFKAKAFGVEGFERLVAVKRILPNIAEDEDFIRMFIDEAKICVQLTHANIAQVFELGKSDDALYIAMEYVSGKDLRTVFETARRNKDPIPAAQVCHTIMKMCEGLDYAHNKKDSKGRDLHIVHRDISPQNILISFEGEVKLIDFGIAKAAGRSSKTAAGTLKGKFGYMSPEQVKGMPLDRRSDVFSVGIILYELLTLERLFLGDSDFATLEKIRNGEIPLPSTHWPDIPQNLEDIVMKALAKNPKERYQSAGQLHDDLHHFMLCAGRVYTGKDMAEYMRRHFSSDIRKEQSKLDKHEPLPAPPPPKCPPIQASPITEPRAVTSPELPNKSLTPSGPFRLPKLEEIIPPDSNPSMDHSLLNDPLDPDPSPSLQLHPEPLASFPLSLDLPWDDDDIETSIYERNNSQETSPPWASSTPQEEGAISAPKRPSKPIILDDYSLFSAANPPYRRADSHPPEEIPHRAVSQEMEELNLPLAPPTQAKLSRSWDSSGRIWFLGAVTVVSILIASVVAYLVLEKRFQNATLELATSPSAAQVYLNGKLVHDGPTPILLKQMNAGRHKLTITHNGFTPEELYISLAPGGSHQITVNLLPLDQSRAKLVVNSSPEGAAVEVNGEPQQGSTPLVLEGLPPGETTIRLLLDGHSPTEKQVVLDGHETTTISFTLEPEDTRRATDTVEAPVAQAPRSPSPPSQPRTPRRAQPRPLREPPSPKAQQGQPTTPKQQPPPPAQPAPSQRAPEFPEQEPSQAKTTAPPSTPAAGSTAAAQPAQIPPTAPTQQGILPSVEQPASTPSKPEPISEKADGFLRISSKPWARVLINGKDTGLTTPILHYPLPPGTHRVSLINENFGVVRHFTVDVVPGRTRTLIVDLN